MPSLGFHQEHIMKILFADSIDEQRLGPLTSAGHDCIIDGSLSADDLPGAIAHADVLVVRSTKVTAATIEAATNLSLIVRAGAGTDNIDKASASAKGIYVCNVPGKNAVAVAELTMGLLLSIDRNIADNVSDLRAGVWNKKLYTKASGLAGKNLAIVGLGEIGLALAERAKGFGLTVSAVRKDDRSDATLQRIRQIGIRLVDDQATLLADADIVSIHVPKSASTAGLVDAAFLAQLPDGAVVLNTSRGEVVDEAALIAALDTRSMRAGLDVFANEPSSGTGEFASEIARHPSVVGTHHIGASTDQAQAAVAEGTIEVIEAYIDGGVINCVNLATTSEATGCLTVRHLDQVGVLAQVFAVLRKNGLNVQQMSNQVFADNGAAVATIRVGHCPDDAVLAELERIDEVLAATATGDDA